MISTLFLLVAVTTFPFTIAKVVNYNFDTYYICGAPDGVKVCHVLSNNGKFPGPTISANIGDTLRVKITNRIQRKGSQTSLTTLHWHGLFQNGSQFQDGPHMVTQCAIPYGKSQTYEFKLQQAGTYWWHSHVSYQYTEGMYGALIVQNLPEVYAADYDDELVIILSDWSHLSGQTNADWFLSPASGGNEPIPYSGLINGRGSFNCSLTTLPCDRRKQVPAEFKVRRGKRYRVRIINTSAMAVFIFSIEGHKLNVIEVDGVDTVKVGLDRIPIAPAQRYSAIVEMNGHAAEYSILAEMSLMMYNFDAPNVNTNPQALNPMVGHEIQPNVIFSAHQHTSRIITYPPIHIKHFDYYDASPISFDFAEMDGNNQLEIMVPTSSDRMGSKEIGYGYGVIENNRLQYTVLWLPNRFTYLFVYLTWVSICTLCSIVFFIGRKCRRNGRKIYRLKMEP